MTFCKVLAEAVKDGKTITATERIDKDSVCPYYQIVISVDGMGYEVIKTAKTTWRRKFKELTETTK